MYFISLAPEFIYLLPHAHKYVHTLWGFSGWLAGWRSIPLSSAAFDTHQCSLLWAPSTLHLFMREYFSLFQCESIAGMGFRRGSYRCVCQRGFYFPNATVAGQKYFNGSTLEEEHEKLMKASLTYLSGRISSSECFAFCYPDLSVVL